MKKISILGVLLGALTDIVSSMFLGIPLGLYAASKVDIAHMQPDQVQSAIIAIMHNSIPLFFTQLLLGSFCSALGGYVAARIAKHQEILSGGLSSFLCVGIGIYSIIAGTDHNSLLVKVLLFIASPAFGLLGGYIRFRQKGDNVCKPDLATIPS